MIFPHASLIVFLLLSINVFISLTNCSCENFSACFRQIFGSNFIVSNFFIADTSDVTDSSSKNMPVSALHILSPPYSARLIRNEQADLHPWLQPGIMPKSSSTDAKRKAFAPAISLFFSSSLTSPKNSIDFPATFL